SALEQRHQIQLPTLAPEDLKHPSALAGDLAEFLRQRLLSLLEEEGIAPDLVQAVAGETVAITRVLTDPADARRRAELLAKLRAQGLLAAVEAVVTRAARLAEKGDLDPGVLSATNVVNPALFAKQSEKAMLAVLGRLEPIAAGNHPDRYAALAAELAASASTLAAFFDGEESVMVMAEDPAVRTNRLNLLAVLRNQAGVLADFSRISG
ncbi:MAG: glycine--tRNA ligase subunit beta, partial [Prochlorococcaceae cyanobacterium]